MADAARPRLLQSLAFRVLALGLAALTWGCDHATKDAASAFANGHGVAVAPGIELTYVENPDIAFSLLHRLGVPHSPLGLAAVSGFALAVLVGVLFTKRASLVTYAGIALIVGGGIGNLVDRLVRGRV